MSEKEFDQGIEELFDVVNRHASPEATQQAERIAEGQQHPSAEARVQFHDWMKEEEKRVRRGAVVQFSVRTILCAVAVFLFLAALLLPNWVPVLCYTGLAACLIVGSIMIDRFVQYRKKW